MHGPGPRLRRIPRGGPGIVSDRAGVDLRLAGAQWGRKVHHHEDAGWPARADSWHGLGRWVRPGQRAVGPEEDLRRPARRPGAVRRFDRVGTPGTFRADLRVEHAGDSRARRAVAAAA